MSAHASASTLIHDIIGSFAESQRAEEAVRVAFERPDAPKPDRWLSNADYNRLSRCRLELVQIAMWLEQLDVTDASKLKLIAGGVRRGLHP